MSKSEFEFYSPNNAPEGCEWMEVLRWLENTLKQTSFVGRFRAAKRAKADKPAKPRSLRQKILQAYRFRTALPVEPQRIELCGEGIDI